MFISQREAEERLKEDRNIFREPLTDLPETGDRNEVAKIDKPFKPGDPEEFDTPEVEEDDPDSSGISLSHLDHLLNPRRPGRARYQGRLESQVAIAETEIIAGSAIAARTFGLSVPQTIAYSQGQRSNSELHPSGNGAPPKPELLARINKTKQELAVKAANRLDLTLNALTPQKISQIKRATNLSKVAKDMSVILDKCTPKDEGDKGGVHFHIYRPELRAETSYTTVNVGPSLPSPELK